jgi:hypothetical protein
MTALFNFCFDTVAIILLQDFKSFFQQWCVYARYRVPMRTSLDTNYSYQNTDFVCGLDSYPRTISLLGYPAKPCRINADGDRRG